MRALVQMLAISVLFAGLRLPAELPAASPVEAMATAEMLYMLTKFIQWPRHGGGEGLTSGQFVVGIVGRDPIESMLWQQLEGQLVAGRPIVLRQVRNMTELRKCRLVFIGASERKRVRQILETLAGSGALTIATIDDFGSSGGMIGLRRTAGKPELSINADQLRRAGLVASSKLLRLATIVRTEGESE